MRGADESYVLKKLLFCGSPPHAWGRFALNLYKRTGVWVHPHMRGADPDHAHWRVLRSLVHPHMRGADQ